MNFLSKIIKMFSEDDAAKTEIPKEAEKSEAKEPEKSKLGLDEEMLSNGVSFEPQNSEGGLEGLFNANEEEKPKEAGKDDAAEPETKPEENKEE